MQIIIPMSGFGERFRRAGYTVPKPLIEVDGKPILSYVVGMFPGETDFIFICNQEHLDHPTYRMREILTRVCPSAKIIGIAPHKLGPVHAVLQAADQIDVSKPTIVNYCDFTCDWDWSDFKRHVAATRCDGAIPAYKGFHPHSLGSTNYAYMQETDGWVNAIQEKQPYTDNRMNEYASSGTYYFASGHKALAAMREAVKQDFSVSGEYYVSLAYQPMLAEGQRISVYPLKHFMQWGTPEDLREYLGWSAAFRRLAEPVSAPPAPLGSVVIPMAGMGMRFAKEGYSLPKPLIPVSGKPMVLQAVGDLPAAKAYAFVMRGDMPGVEAIQQQIQSGFPGSVVHMVPQVTEGQAITARLGLDALEQALGGEAEGPITFGACDNGVLYDAARFQALLDGGADVIVWGARGHANAVRRPQMFGWIVCDGDDVTGVSVKKPLSDPAHDPIVIATFTFRNGAVFRHCVERLVARDGRVNGEFYLDSVVEDALALGYKCKILSVDHFLSWGTPDDLRTFEYWQECFDGWAEHPYRLSKDARAAVSHETRDGVSHAA